MLTEKRLTECLSSAKLQMFDDSSKYVFFSDCHRGDDSVSDEFARNQQLMASALKYYYNHGYTYVEVGDGDELWEHANFKHIRAAHVDIFTIMKQFFKKNRLIYIYGNHNIYMKNKYYLKKHYYFFYDDYKEKEVSLFYGIKPLESFVLEYKKTHQKILVVHGHQGDFFNDQAWVLSMMALRYFWKFMHLVGFRNPASPAKNQQKRHKIEKNYTKWIQKNKVMLICGHTHRMKFPRPGELPYFNTGCCIRTKGINGLEISEGKIMLIQWRIEADNSGIMHANRKIIYGPESIESFQWK